MQAGSHDSPGTPPPPPPSAEERTSVGAAGYLREVTFSSAWAAIGGHWMLIVGITVVAVAGAAIYKQVRPSGYAAVATMAELMTSSTVQLDAGLKTRSDAGAGGARQRQAYDRAHQQLLITLIGSRDVAKRVARELRGRPGLEHENAAALRGQVEVDVEPGNDLYDVTVHRTDPKTAALIANTWSRVAQDYVSEQLTLEMSSKLDSLTGPSKRLLQKYQKAQQALEQFLADSPMVRLQRQIRKLRQIADDFTRAARLLDEAQALQARPSGQAAAVPRLALLLLQYRAFAGGSPSPWEDQDLSPPSSGSKVASSTAAATRNSPDVQLQVAGADGTRGGGGGGAGGGGDAPAGGQAQALVNLLEARMGRLGRNVEARWRRLKAGSSGQVAETSPLKQRSEEQRKNEQRRSKGRLYDATTSASSVRIDPVKGDGKGAPAASPSTSASDGDSADASPRSSRSDVSSTDQDAAARTQRKINAVLTRLHLLYEQASAKQTKLTQLRDIAWNSYASTRRIQAAASVPGGVETTRLWTVSSAVPPERRSQSLAAVLLVVGVVAAGLAVMLSFALDSSAQSKP